MLRGQGDVHEVGGCAAQGGCELECEGGCSLQGCVQQQLPVEARRARHTGVADDVETQPRGCTWDGGLWLQGVQEGG
jgi:hypothetical protein